MGIESGNNGYVPQRGRVGTTGHFNFWFVGSEVENRGGSMPWPEEKMTIDQKLDWLLNEVAKINLMLKEMETQEKREENVFSKINERLAVIEETISNISEKVYSEYRELAD